jgi:hypothetical protein
MRLFILERTLLKSVALISDPPRPGDVVAWFRAGQDPDGTACAALEQSGIRMIAAELLIEAEATREIDTLGARYLHEWYIKDGYEFGRLGTFSLGKSYGLEFARQANPRYLIRTGEIVRRLIVGHPEAEEIFSDLADGESVIRVRPVYQPLAKIAAHVALAHGCAIRFIRSPDSLPPGFKRGRKSGWQKIVRSFIGGKRLVWIVARFRARRVCKDGRPRLYVFIGRGLDMVAERLAATGQIQVVASALGIPGVEAIRYDHLFALPRTADIRGARRLLRHARNLARHPDHAGAFTLNDVSYGPIIADAFANLLETEIWPFLVVVAQARKLQRLVGFDSLIVNGAGNEPMGILVALNRDTSRKVFLVSHGLDLHKIAIFCPVVDNPHVTHITYGSDHCDDYSLYLPESEKPRLEVIGSPVTTMMAPVRGKRSSVHGKRLLILAFGHLDFWNAARIRACDQYFVEVFKVAEALISEGWSVTCRPHPHHPQDLEMRIAAELGVGHAIHWNSTGDFNEALLGHDVVVSNLTSACYQALYAGWPTIFYEPDYLPEKGLANLEADPMLTGLVTACDIERPVTNDPSMLAGMIRDTLDPESPTSKFPEKFTTMYANRFIGPRAADADNAIVEFFEKEFTEMTN